MKPLSTHQKRCLVAALELERRLARHRLRYWDWTSIGEIVSGDWTGRIGGRTVSILRTPVLCRPRPTICRGRSRPRCCAIATIISGGSLSGRQTAAKIKVVWSDHDKKYLNTAVQMLKAYRRSSLGDDRHDGGGDGESPVVPTPVPAGGVA